MGKSTIYFRILALFGMPILIFCYFFLYRTQTIYGDDLFIFRDFEDIRNGKDQLSLMLASQKFRPISFFLMKWVASAFGKHLMRYYIFNVCIQTINTFVFAAIVNLVIKSEVLSLVISLLVGFSRFALYNISQLFCGGPLEGLAMTFFLVAFYFIVRLLLANNSSAKNMRSMYIAILFSNLALYTHERYIVIFPFLFLLLFFKPSRFGRFSDRLILGALIVVSIAGNVFVKKVILGMDFFVGTGGTKIQFSLKNAFGYLVDGMLSIIQINSGPEYLVGLPHTSLSIFYQIILILLQLGLVAILYLAIRAYWQKNGAAKSNLSFSLAKPALFAILFFLCLVPAISTIRLEQRWLQASFSIFVLLVVLFYQRIVSDMTTKKGKVFFLSFITLFIFSDQHYLHAGVNNFYLKEAERSAGAIEESIQNGIVRRSTAKVIIYSKVADANGRNAFSWAIGGGYLFSFYNCGVKELEFIDSAGIKDDDLQKKVIDRLDMTKDQVLQIRDGHIIDVTNSFARSGTN